jgi:hypothetical protein
MGAGFPMKGLARHGAGPSAPKQAISPGDLTPPEKWYNVCAGLYNMMGQDGDLLGCPTSLHVCHIS